ncbi:MAG TPA: c-type cytochrome [Methylocella sp.]|jgi:mono/diheme cytochrome c family protein
MTSFTILTAFLSLVGFVTTAGAQSTDPTIGRHLAETICSTCHQIDASSPTPSPNSSAPSFVDVSRMPSTTELSIKVFLRSPHPSMPDIILSPDEIDSVAAYILSLARK